MSIVLSVYTKNAYKEFQLPASNNADYDIGISSQVFLLKEDLTLRLEAVEGKWRLRHSRAYTLEKESGDPYDYLRSDDILRITTWLEERITVVVTERESTFEVLNKYSIASLNQVTVGSASENDIRYRFLDLVSRRHAVLKKNGKDWIIEEDRKSVV